MKQLKAIIFFTLVLTKTMLAGNVTDTIHAKRYSIFIDTLNYNKTTIKGHTFITVQSRLNGVDNISIDLLQLTIDSVLYKGQPLLYSYDGLKMRIKPQAPLNTGDTVILQINYHGKPQTDPVFGGFVFNGNYVFNIGVGFKANPHNLGRAWFPCIDVFDDKAYYDFHITTPPLFKAYCNGSLQGVTTNADGNKVFHWSLSKPIPPYLAGMAVAPFVELHGNYKGIPMLWAVMPADTNKTKLFFSKIDTAMRLFINAYGPYPWEKVGYIAVPFNGGAMEHATSIHIGQPFIDGTLNYETIGPHELSHMWWGDKVTCAGEQEMWLNEGFASYNERFFTQAAYGETAYKNSIRTNHRSVLQLTHTPGKDSAYYAMNAIPHDFTYGSTVYDKGADMVHTLRHYMGDANFFSGCRNYLATYNLGNANSMQLRDALGAGSGMDMTRFFADWIFTPGFPHFSIDSVNATPLGNGKYNIAVYTRQRQKGNSHIYKMPLECRLTDGVYDTTIVITVDTLNNSFNLILPFIPKWTALDRDEKVSDAISDNEQVISATGNVTFLETNVSLNVKNRGTGTSTLRIEHNWVAPDPVKNVAANLRVSDYHYWKIDGLPASGFVAAATFNYNGSTDAKFGYIDNTFITQNEDSLVIAYRHGPGEDWVIAPHQKLNEVVRTDKKGSIVVDSIKVGEYVLAQNGNFGKTTGVAGAIKTGDDKLLLVPNPVQQSINSICTINFTINKDIPGNKICIYSIDGHKVYQTNVYARQQNIKWDCHAMAAGTYIVTLEENGLPVSSHKLIVQ